MRNQKLYPLLISHDKSYTGQILKTDDLIQIKTQFTREKTGSIQNRIDQVWDRTQNFADVYTESILNYVALTRDRSSHLITDALTPYEDLSLLKDLAPFVVRLKERCHY